MHENDDLSPVNPCLDAPHDCLGECCDSRTVMDEFVEFWNLWNATFTLDDEISAEEGAR